MNEQERNDLIRYRIMRSKETMKEVKILLENDFWNAAVNRLYYACFYAISALLLKNNITAQTHSGIRQMFGLHFVKTKIISRELGKFYTDLFDKRQTGDYADFVFFDRESVEHLIPISKELIQKIENLLSKK